MRVAAHALRPVGEPDVPSHTTVGEEQMSEAPKKYIEFLDQLIPLVAAAPDWFKVWIYILIFLIFATIAATGIFYLNTKFGEARKQSWQAFVVERPKDNEKIPLGKSQNWMLEGTFPVVAKDDLSSTARIDVQVYQLPDRDEVQQSGTVRLSTVEGQWSFESAKFPGNGSYEIVVTAFLGGRSAYRRVKVECIDKATAYRSAIEVDRKQRGVPSIEPEKAATVSLPA